MNFKDALELANEKQYLIGKNYNGARIDEIIIYPSSQELFEQYSKGYILSENAQQAVLRYIDSDLSVGVVCDKHRISRDSLFLFSEIERLENLLDE